MKTETVEHIIRPGVLGPLFFAQATNHTGTFVEDHFPPAVGYAAELVNEVVANYAALFYGEVRVFTELDKKRFASGLIKLVLALFLGQGAGEGHLHSAYLSFVFCNISRKRKIAVAGPTGEWRQQHER